jgi:hypothetical protein
MSSFLDNSGDIILDAVLTKEGRKRLAEGSFRIAKYAFGDDEIDYGLYDKNNASGSAYYDLEILQTPIFQSNTSNSAELRFKLTTNANESLLYMPSLKVNQKITTESVLLYNGLLYLAVNEETKNKLNSSIGTTNSIQSAQQTGLGFLVESGLDTSELTADPANRSMITAQNMLDTSFSVQTDTRFINAVMASRSGTFTNSPTSVTTTFGPMRITPASSNVAGLTNYIATSVTGIPNTVMYQGTSTVADTETSAIAGPRGTVLKVNLSVVPGLSSISSASRSPLWQKHGAINQTLSGLVVDQLDTILYIEGTRSGAILQQPVRLVRYISG